ncbi:keto-hydroxyglutarate-aldolase/keto-deoxy-phosphogluconate aldolase [Alginatibacterium sediminis]|uniref:Keto-hydroxyglutarate-aldolase/keto-deoxy-phosphogluconate aldolase n=1 Tax=Alginatibacterium sediminis TaxID=2164068 RepID=A0A420ELC0_9ALTE|nr:bifunctional 4-hydroxy-2-oxoglutarate aldolase/2-dehydro-3-deoxy-phosphogluconate aldolase [Alginatibacterium sediminis]RKF21541.1 keto-hydroxyglutarate-aldolase/keto-deoxy-phosphogluconate aldolase [Alginatibacterium sediminis]
MSNLVESLRAIKVVPVIAINNAEHAAPLAKVLIENGLPCAEVTYRTPAAEQAIRNMRDAYPDLIIGAGTVLTSAQVDSAIDAGVDFIVSPGLNPTTVKYCQQRGVTIVPGVNSPSQVEQAMELGLETLKFFPAGPSGGVNMLKALTAVYPIQFMPTGGVSPSNVHEYLDIPAVFACGGTWMVPNNLVDEERWDELAELVASVAKLFD